MHQSFQKQVERLILAGFPCSVITAVAESLLQKIKRGGRKERADVVRKTVRPEVVPYVHKVSHHMKKVATKHGIPVVFSAPRKLSALCPRISAAQKRACNKKHARPFVKCCTGVVYKIPLSCGKAYIGQTGRCIMIEHGNMNWQLRIGGQRTCLRIALTVRIVSHG